MTKTRVLQVVLSLAPGGTERMVIELAKRARHDVETSVCCLDERGAWAAELAQYGIPVVTLGRRPGFHPSLGYHLARVARDCGATVLHCHHYSPFVYGSIAATWDRNLKLVFTEHGRLSDGPPSLKRRLANQILARRRAVFSAVSADLRRHLEEEGFPASRVRVIPNGIEIGQEVTRADRDRAHAALGLPADVRVFATIARFDAVKDLATLVDAFALVARRRESHRLLLVGDGPERVALESRVDRLGLRGQVTFAGMRSDARDLLPAADVYVNSSITEGISLTLLEAMAASLPVVATRVGGTPEIVEEGTTGWLVPARRPEPLAAAMLRLDTDPGACRAMGRAGRALAVSEFSLDTMVRRYLDAYRLAEAC